MNKETEELIRHIDDAHKRYAATRRRGRDAGDAKSAMAEMILTSWPQLRAALERMQKDAERLDALEKAQKYAGKVLAEHRECIGDVDGGSLQDFAVECGMLEERQVTEPCGDNCTCAEVTDFPTKCYFLSPAGRAAIDSAMQGEQPQQDKP